MPAPATGREKKVKSSGPSITLKNSSLKEILFQAWMSLTAGAKRLLMNGVKKSTRQPDGFQTSTICWKKNNYCSHCQSFIIQPAKCKNVLSARTVSLVSTVTSTVSLLNMWEKPFYSE
jgi:hypothetical protein